jgi:hypothetical protein
MSKVKEESFILISHQSDHHQQITHTMCSLTHVFIFEKKNFFLE